jgi:hypothetical protein
MSADSGREPAPFNPQVAILALIQMSIVLAVAVLVTGRVFEAMPALSGPMADAYTAVQTQTGTAFELAPIVLIVVVAAVVIATVRRV